MLTEKQDNCWICEREIKGYVFWTADMAHKSKKFVKISAAEKQVIFEELDELKAIDTLIPPRPTPYVEPVPEVPGRQAPPKEKPPPEPEPSYRTDPMICGEFTDWKARPMLTLFDYFQSKEPPENKLDYRSQFEQMTKNFEWGSNFHITQFELCNSYHLHLLERSIRQKELFLFENWQDKFESTLSHKKPFFVNSEVIRNEADYRKIYIAPIFSKSGRQMFVIQPGKGCDTVELYQTVVDFRQEEVP